MHLFSTFGQYFSWSMDKDKLSSDFRVLEETTMKPKRYEVKNIGTIK